MHHYYTKLPHFDNCVYTLVTTKSNGCEFLSLPSGLALDKTIHGFIFNVGTPSAKQSQKRNCHSIIHYYRLMSYLLPCMDISQWQFVQCGRVVIDDTIRWCSKKTTITDVNSCLWNGEIRAKCCFSLAFNNCSEFGSCQPKLPLLLPSLA